ncbi:MAG: pentapeptide repeat-containing protein [Paracoccaceae bacterium]
MNVVGVVEHLGIPRGTMARGSGLAIVRGLWNRQWAIAGGVRVAAGGPEAGGQADGSAPANPRGGPGALFLFLVFGFGAAAGLLLAVVGTGLLAESGSLILTALLSALVVLAAAGGLVLAFRGPILRRLFGVAETQVEMFADPLQRAAAAALARDAGSATHAARDLVALALARYAWLSARRWIITSLTALIAAMAALAGTALLFKQNTLIETQTRLLAAQNELLTQQNAKVEAQTALLSQDVQLAEAQRNAALSVEMTTIAAEIGKAAERAARRFEADAAAAGETIDPLSDLTYIIDPVTGLDRALMLRIVSVSRAARPYRFLDTGLSPDDPDDRMRVAMEGRREDLPGTWARMADATGWTPTDTQNRLIDRLSSPERGQLLQILFSGGLRNLEALNQLGLDLNFAQLQDSLIGLVTAGGAQLSYADFTGTHIRSSDFGGAFLDNARFRRTFIADTTFAILGSDRMRPPYRADDAPMPSSLVGADFRDAFLRRVDFSGATLMASRFDGAVIAGVDFGKTSLGASSLRGAVILKADFTGADLRSVDFDGAILFGADPLAALAASAERFVADRFTATPVGMDAVMRLRSVSVQLTEDEVAAISAGAPAFRIARVKPFDD